MTSSAPLVFSAMASASASTRRTRGDRGTTSPAGARLRRAISLSSRWAEIYRTDALGAVCARLTEAGAEVAGFSPPSLREQWTGLP